MPTVQEGTVQPKNRVWYVSTEKYVNPIVAYATERYGRRARSFKEQQLALYQAYSPAALNQAISQHISQTENVRLRIARGNADAVAETNRSANNVLRAQQAEAGFAQDERNLELRADIATAQTQSQATRRSGGSSSGSTADPLPRGYNPAASVDNELSLFSSSMLRPEVYRDPETVKTAMETLSKDIGILMREAASDPQIKGVGTVYKLARHIGGVYNRIRDQDQAGADAFLETAKEAMNESWHPGKWSYVDSAVRLRNRADFEQWSEEAIEAMAAVSSPVSPLEYTQSSSAAAGGAAAAAVPAVTYDAKSSGVTIPEFEEQERTTAAEAEEILAPFKQFMTTLQGEKAASQRLFTTPTAKPKAKERKRWNPFARKDKDKDLTETVEPEIAVPESVVPVVPVEPDAEPEDVEVVEPESDLDIESAALEQLNEDPEVAAGPPGAAVPAPSAAQPAPSVAPPSPLSPRMTASSVATRRGIANVPNEEQTAALAMLEKQVIKPLESLGRVTSAFRSKELNAHKDIGGHRNSRHMAGNAVDLAPKPGVPLAKLVKAANALVAKGVAKKVIVYDTPAPGHIHVAMKRS